MPISALKRLLYQFRGFLHYILKVYPTMTPTQIRLPAAVVAALRAQAQALGLGYSAHLRSQLTTISRKPNDILKATREAVSA